MKTQMAYKELIKFAEEESTGGVVASGLVSGVPCSKSGGFVDVTELLLVHPIIENTITIIKITNTTFFM